MVESMSIQEYFTLLKDVMIIITFAILVLIFLLIAHGRDEEEE